MAVVVIGITLVVNLMAEQFNVKWDMTPNKMYSVGDQTKTILKNLDKDVEVVMLSEADQLKSTSAGFLVKEFLDKYDKYDKVKVSYIDPDKNPNVIRDFDKEGTMALKRDEIIVKSGSKVRKITAPDIFQQDYYGPQMFLGEQALTGAIKYVTSDKTPTIYFLEGPNAGSLEKDYTNLKKVLENNNYTVKKVNLTVENKVPEDANILISASPKTDLSVDEKNKISEYLKNGGNAVFLFDPDNSDKKFTQFESVLAEYNIALNYDKVIENNPQRHVANRPYDIVPDVKPHDINNGQDLSRFTVIMPESRSLKTLRNDKDPLTILPLLTTSEAAVGQPFGGGEGEENHGPLDIALAAEYKSAITSKVVVIGNSYFVTDEAFEKYYPYSQYNMQILGLSVDWMHDKSNDVFIVPKSSTVDSVSLSGFNARIVVIATVFGLPLLVAALGIIIWLRRRHL